jgi:nucleotide sugar dehydrogenase|tara:strand:- start:3209 stop:4885 length:1677 start_codon:yes stop_codon:yes gene_type:complete
MDYLLKKMIFNQDATLRDAIECCLAGAKKVSFCVDEERKLLGLLTQGDLLRILKDGQSVDAPAVDFINRNPVIISDNVTIKEAKKHIGNRIQLIPQLDENGKLVGLVNLSSSDYDFINIKDKKVLVVGLGYVGLTLSLILADSGFSVNGYDISEELTSKLENKIPPFYEAGIEEFINTHVGRRIKILRTLDDCVAEVFIITVGSPIHRETKKPVTDNIIAAAKSVGRILSKDCLILLRSTVPVGCTRDLVIPELEQQSGLRAGEDFFVAYCPERTTEGQALEELRYLPQIVGGLDDRSIEVASRLFNEYTSTIVNVGSLEAAEFSKLIDNVYRDVKFAFANQIAELSERLGLNVHQLIDAVNHHYLRNNIPKPSPGVGGPCLTKDSYILKDVFTIAGMDAPLLAASRIINEQSPKRIVQRADITLKSVGKGLNGARVFVVGFAFKGEPETSDLRDSTTLWFLDELKKCTTEITGFDPVVQRSDLVALGIKVSDPAEGFLGADAVFIMNNHKSYLKWDLLRYLRSMKKPALFFDAWHLFQKNKFTDFQGIQYLSIGVGH